MKLESHSYPRNEGKYPGQVLRHQEAVAMRLEPLGKVRVVSVDDGKGKK